MADFGGEFMHDLDFNLHNCNLSGEAISLGVYLAVIQLLN